MSSLLNAGAHPKTMVVIMSIKKITLFNISISTPRYKVSVQINHFISEGGKATPYSHILLQTLQGRSVFDDLGPDIENRSYGSSSDCAGSAIIQVGPLMVLDSSQRSPVAEPAAAFHFQRSQMLSPWWLWRMSLASTFCTVCCFSRSCRACVQAALAMAVRSLDVIRSGRPIVFL